MCGNQPEGKDTHDSLAREIMQKTDPVCKERKNHLRRNFSRTGWQKPIPSENMVGDEGDCKDSWRTGEQGVSTQSSPFVRPDVLPSQPRYCAACGFVRAQLGKYDEDLSDDNRGRPLATVGTAGIDYMSIFGCKIYILTQT